MKRTVLSVLFLVSVFTGAFADEKGINLIPVPDKLLQSLPSAIISGANNDFELPVSVDVGSSVLIARSQGSLGSCASWATASELTRIERIRNNWPVGKNSSYFSPLFLYNSVNGGSDRGSSIYSNLNILVNNGCSLYVTFPYIEDYRIQPSVSARREAARYRIEEFKTIPVNVDSIKQALAAGHGVIVSFQVSDAFDSYTGGIYKPGGQSGVERKGERFLWHGMLIVGYNDAEKNLKILNSWGPTWGTHQGFMHIAYDDVSALIREAYIIIPKNSLPTTAVPPSHFTAGKGTNKNKVALSWEQNGAEEYEIFRVSENEFYTSLGKTPRNYFEVTDVVPNQKQFYCIAAHKGEYMSELSYVQEGWSSDSAAEAPGTPGAFSVRLQGKAVIAQWRAVEGDNLIYQIYRFDDALGEYVLAGETAETTLRIPLSARITSPVVTFFVLTKNANGSGIPSEPAALTIDKWEKPNEQGKDEITKYEIYRGNFYQFPLARFMAIERRAMEHFRMQREQFSQKFRGFKNRALVNSENQRNEFINKVQKMNERLQGGK